MKCIQKQNQTIDDDKFVVEGDLDFHDMSTFSNLTEDTAQLETFEKDNLITEESPWTQFHHSQLW